MYRLLFPLIIIFSITFTQEDGEVIKNVTATQRTDGSKILDIYYDLEEHELYTSYDISVKVEYPDADHTFYLTNCSGDVWFDIFPGDDKQIQCQLGSEIESQYLSGEFLVNVHAEAHAVSELPDSFVFETISTESGEGQWFSTTLIENDYELMQYEVTAVQYVEFLNSVLSTAITVDNQDTDGWPEQEGGETFYRTYNFENGSMIKIIYANPGGNINGNYLDNDDPGYGTISGYYDVHPSAWGVNLASWNTPMEIWLGLAENSNNDPYPKIQFSSSAAGADDFSFFITPGKGNHPIVDVTLYGADAFADFYGLRIPSTRELLYPLYGQFPFNDDCGLAWEDNMCGSTSILNFPVDDLFMNYAYDPCDSWNFSCQYNTTGMGYSCEELNNEFETCSTSPVGTQGLEPGASPYQIYDLFGNAREISLREFNNYEYENHNIDMTSIFLTFYETILFGGGYSHGGSGTNAIYEYMDYTGYNLGPWNETPSLGFRCARTIQGNDDE